MSSHEIAQLCEKRHDHVLRDIEKMIQDIGDPRLGASSFERLVERRVIIQPPTVGEQDTDAMGRKRTTQKGVQRSE